MTALDEADRQMILLALADKSLTSPGFALYCGDIAAKLDGRAMFEEFRRLRADVVKPFPGEF